MILKGTESIEVSLPMYDNATVQIRPLSIGRMTNIKSACKTDPNLDMSILIVKECVVEKELRENIGKMKYGVIKYLLDQILRISGYDDRIFLAMEQ